MSITPEGKKRFLETANDAKLRVLYRKVEELKDKLHDKSYNPELLDEIKEKTLECIQILNENSTYYVPLLKSQEFDLNKSNLSLA